MIVGVAKSPGRFRSALGSAITRRGLTTGCSRRCSATLRNAAEPNRYAARQGRVALLAKSSCLRSRVKGRGDLLANVSVKARGV